MKIMYPYLKKYKFWIILSVIGVGVAALADIIIPRLFSDIVDIGIKTGSRDFVVTTGIKMLIVAVIAVLGAVLGAYCASRVGAGFSADIRHEIFSKVQDFGQEEIGEFGTASLITRNINDVQRVQMYVNAFMRVFVRAPIIFVGGAVMAYSQSPRLALPILIAVPIILLIIILIARIVRPFFRALQSKLDTLNQVFREQISGVRVIRAFGNEDHEEKRFDGVSSDYTKTGLKAYRRIQVMSPLLTIVMNFTVLAILWFAANAVGGSSDFAEGALIAVVQYAMQIMFSLVLMSMVFVMQPSAIASAERIGEVLTKDISIKDLAHVTPLNEKVVGKIEFRNVSFRFPDAEEYTLENINFISNPGETTSLIGSTGSGKSTIVNLILRFYDVTQGLILVDDVDIREMSQEDLRSIIGFVPQKSVLFSGTIEENIKYGNESMSQEEMEAAAEAAQAADFINGRDGGYMAEVSQGGTNFSGGQKQRLSIARAIARDPKIFLFDDSFSALDAETDRKLRTALDKKVAGATRITVAQRVSSIMDSNQIVVLESGKVVGKGTHKGLMESCQVYREIAESQFSDEEVAG